MQVLNPCLVLSLLVEEARVMIYESGCLGTVKEQHQDEELFELECLESILKTRTIAVRDCWVGKSGSYVRIVQQPGKL